MRNKPENDSLCPALRGRIQSKERAMEPAVERYGFCPDMDQGKGSIGAPARTSFRSCKKAEMDFREMFTFVSFRLRRNVVYYAIGRWAAFFYLNKTGCASV